MRALRTRTAWQNRPAYPRAHRHAARRLAGGPLGGYDAGGMEMFQLVDSGGRPIGSAERAACHGNPALIHAVVHLHVLDRSGRLYLQRRALSKDTNPGRWDTSVGGHVAASEPVADALGREAREELGIDATGARPLFAYLYRSRFESEYAHCFALAYDGPFRIDPVEIAEGRFFTFAEIEAMRGTGALTPMFEHELPMLRQALAAHA